MSETLALFRFALARHRTPIAILLTVVVLGWIFALVSAREIIHSTGSTPINLEDTFILQTLLLTLLPAAACTLILFDYGSDKDMASAESGCSDWLLRMPIASWKIAIVPVVMKSAWISGIWILFSVMARMLGIDKDVVPIWTPCFGFSAAVIGVLCLSWRPFRSGWTRIGLLTVVGLVLYGTLIGTFVRWPGEFDQRPWAIGATIIYYVLGVWLTIRAITLARTSSRGVIPQSGRAGSAVDGGVYAVRRLSGPVQALVWHDLWRASGAIRYALILGVGPLVALATLLVPMNGASVGIALFLFMILGLSAASSSGTAATWAAKSTLPSYIAASPMGTETVAWTKMVTMVGISVAVWSCVLFVFAGWSLSPDNRETWNLWASARSLSLGAPHDVVSIGVRWSMAIVLMAMVFLAGRMASFQWIDMIGRGWVNVVVTIGLSLLFLAPMIVFLRWFLKQTDWETTTESMYSWLRFVPHIVAVLLVGKAISTVLAAVTLRKYRLTTHQQLGKLVAIWSVLALVIAAVLAALIPDPRATFLWCLAATAITIPLARVMILPLSLSLNRHR